VKITLKAHLSHLTGVILAAVMLIGFYIFFYLSELGLSKETICFGLFIFLLISLDSIVFHIRYYLVNKKDSFDIISKDKLKIVQDGRGVLLNTKDVDYIECHMPPSTFNNTIGWSNRDNYSFLNIFDKKGNVFIITSLMNKNLILPKDFEEKVIRIKRIFCWPK